jgi:hypothetical protein
MRQALQLRVRKRFRVHNDAALRAAVWQVHDGALPGHPHRQRLDFVQRHHRAVAQAALERPPRLVVLHPVAGEDADRPVIHAYREVHRQLALRMRQHGDHALVQLQQLRDAP